MLLGLVPTNKMAGPPLIHRVTVKTRGNKSFNDFGEPVYTYSSTYTSIPARVETYQPKIKYNDQGQRPMTKIIVYFDSSRTLLQSQQEIEAVSVPGYTANEFIGRIEQVVPAILGNTTTINHYEAMLEDGS